jgi:hypothetical protein
MDNATLIRLNAQRGAALEELGKQTRFLLDRICKRIDQESLKETGNKHVPDTFN